MVVTNMLPQARLREATRNEDRRMVRWIAKRGYTPIGVDLGSNCIKMVQLSSDRTRLIAAARWDVSEGPAPAPPIDDAAWIKGVQKAREDRRFRGRDAVLCLGARELFVQNVRVAKVPSGDLAAVVRQELVDRLPFPMDEAEVRYLEAADIRQGELTRREVIVLACHKPVLARLLEIVEAAGLRPVAVDVEPLALLRCYASQFRRDRDKQQRALFVHIGASNTAIVIAEGTDALFIKYIEIGGRRMDEAVARCLKMQPAEAWSLRRHNGDRRADEQDPEVARSVAEAIRPVVDRLVNEVSLCVRYHSVTFRGQPLARLVLGGGEATPALLEALATRLELKCELGEPLRSFEASPTAHRLAQWDIAAGLALRGTT